jgi:serine-type D-Ala-D-Ala endopeptidase (penicillin-binding protein 7)
MRRTLSILVLCSIFFNWPAVYAYTKPLPITATSWLVADETGRVIQSQNATQQRSIASITKLMTAMVVLDADQDLTEHIGTFTRYDLIQLMLVKSDNHAAELLCSNYPTGRSSCITAMNNKARSLGLLDTHYVDPSGLNIMNVSTAQELVQVVLEARKYPAIVEASHTDHGRIKEKKHVIVFKNTNPLVATHDFIVSKTGYIHASGGCIVMMLNTEIGQRIVVLLNSKNTHTRIPEAYKLAVSY